MTAHLFVKDIQPSDSSVPVGATAIASIAEEITYRGYPLSELAEHCTFEEVAQLLLRGELPGLREKNRFEHRLNASRHLPEGLCELLASLPAWTPPIESLRTSVSVLAHFDQDAPDQSIEAKLRKAERMLGQIPTAIAWRARALAGLQPVEPREGLGHAAQFLHQLRGKEPQPHEARALEMALIVFAEHEFNPSTYTARVVASTGSDLHSSVVAAICALKGQRHGGFDEEVVRLLVSLEEKESAGATITRADLPTGPIPGFGHPLYPQGDPRAALLEPLTHQALLLAGHSRMAELSTRVCEHMAAEHGLNPSIEWAVGRLFHALGLDVELFAPVLVMARLVGWSAHHLEQHADPKAIRPRATYKGSPQRPVPPLAERKDI